LHSKCDGVRKWDIENEGGGYAAFVDNEKNDGEKDV